MVRQIFDRDERRRIAREILSDLPDWFGNPQAVDDYVERSAQMIFFAAFEQDNPAGFLCLNQTGRDTVEISVMGVRRKYHRRGFGRALFECARDFARAGRWSFMQVKTVRAGEYKDYDETNAFYVSMGFKEFEVLPDFWDRKNPCQIYVMSLRQT